MTGHIVHMYEHSSARSSAGASVLESDVESGENLAELDLIQWLVGA